MLHKALITTFIIAATAFGEEEVKFKPQFRYRTIAVTPNRKAAFNKTEHRDNQQQFFISLLTTGSADLMDSFVIEPVIKTKQTRFDETEPDLLIDQAYITSNLTENIELISGRRIQFSGTGLFINPSDLLNEQKNIFDPFFGREGYTMTSLKFYTGDMQFELGFAPIKGEMLKNGRYYAATTGGFGKTNYVLNYKNETESKSTWGLATSSFLTDHLEVHLDSRYQTRQRSSSFERERLYSDLAPEDPSTVALVGTRYAFSFEHSIILEYLYNQSGLKPEEFAAFFDYIRTAADIEKEPDNRLLGREYLILSYFHKELFKNTSYEMAIAHNIQDSSGFLTAQLARNLSGITFIELRTVLFAGGRNQEFGETPFPQTLYMTVGAAL